MPRQQPYQISKDPDAFEFMDAEWGDTYRGRVEQRDDGAYWAVVDWPRRGTEEYGPYKHLIWARRKLWWAHALVLSMC